MADYLVADTDLTAVADAIRTKANVNTPLSFPLDFVSAVSEIEIEPVQLTVSSGSASKISGTTDDYLLTMS